MLNTDDIRKYAERAHTLVSLQAIEHCPHRRLELEAMAPHLACMLTQTVDELCKNNRCMNVGDWSQQYTNLDRKILEIVGSVERIKLREISGRAGDAYTSRQVEDSLANLRNLGDITYTRRGSCMGWSLA